MNRRQVQAYAILSVAILQSVLSGCATRPSNTEISLDCFLGMSIEAVEFELRLSEWDRYIIREPPLVCRGVGYSVNGIDLMLFARVQDGRRLYAESFDCRYAELRALPVVGIVRIQGKDVLATGDVPFPYGLPPQDLDP